MRKTEIVGDGKDDRDEDIVVVNEAETREDVGEDVGEDAIEEPTPRATREDEETTIETVEEEDGVEEDVEDARRRRRRTSTTRETRTWTKKTPMRTTIRDGEDRYRRWTSRTCAR